MSVILNIDTSLQNASVCLAYNGEALSHLSNNQQRDHAAFLHVAIKDILQKENIKMNELDAVAVISGPGSYTGLRVGMATAKGLCYALNIPLICIQTFTVMCKAAKNFLIENNNYFNGWFCPMIDARRMEVFTVLCNQNGDYLTEPQALILSEKSFFESLNQNSILFFGNGSNKFKTICTHASAHFEEINFSSIDMIGVAYEMFLQKQFSDLAYSEPFYLKGFYSKSV